MLKIFESHLLLVPFLHSLCLAFQWRLLTFSPPFHVFWLVLTPSKDDYFSRPQYWHGRCVQHGYSLAHPSELCLESAGQAWFDRFAVGLNTHEYFCKGQVAENLATLTASFEILRFLSFYSDVQTSKAPYLHIKKWIPAVWGDNLLVNNHHCFTSHAAFVWRI